MDYKSLILTLSEIHVELRTQSVRAVNSSLTIRNWLFGWYITEFEQNGNDRAIYGQKLLFSISKELRLLKIPNSDERELRRYRQFYQLYPSFYKVINGIRAIRGLLPPEFIRKSVLDTSRFLGINVPASHYSNLYGMISYSHFVELIRIKEPLARLFYEIELMKGSWSVKELKRQIGSLLYERTGLSENKTRVLELANSNHLQQNASELIRDPYIFEFLGYKSKDVLPEKELEQALLNNLSDFLLELGKGFCFEARQKRLTIDNEHYFIDMVFYHRILHCNVLIELKTERFNYAHVGQLNMYLEYFKKYEMHPGDNPPVGILLCSYKDQEHVEFATAGIDEKVFVSQYLIGLPEKSALEKFIKSELIKGQSN